MFFQKKKTTNQHKKTHPTKIRQINGKKQETENHEQINTNKNRE